jgi:hypothetical protein
MNHVSLRMLLASLYFENCHMFTSICMRIVPFLVEVVISIIDSGCRKKVKTGPSVSSHATICSPCSLGEGSFPAVEILHEVAGWYKCAFSSYWSHAEMAWNREEQTKRRRDKYGTASVV